MQKYFLPLFLFIASISHAQNLKYVSFTNGADLSSFSFITDQKIIIKITPTGDIIEWGYDHEPGRFYYKTGRLQPYLGRVEYYEKQFDSILNGKVKNIGTTSILYYGSYENESLVGKVKSIGTLWIDYYTNFENEMVRGKLKSAGQKTFSYYTSFENEAYRGKLKSVAHHQVTYYSTFDDKLIRGKLKSVGPHNYSWYTSMDRHGYQGGLKSGIQYLLLEGVTFIIW
jgi:hypothetical protein